MAEHRESPGMREEEARRSPAPLELPAEKVLGPLEAFARNQSTTGAVLLLALVVALAMANSDYRDLYISLNHLPLTISLGEWRLSMSLHHWVNEGLMVFFFFILGLEVKREFLAGDLRDLRSSMLVLVMAAGGVLFPATIYLVFMGLSDASATQGWAIPMATDTAFALGILALLGSRAPGAVTLLLTALAIVDDIAAVLVISVFYSQDLDPSALTGVLAALGLLWLFNLVGLRHPLFYAVGGIVLWAFVLQSGVHATTAGILAAAMVPARPYATTGWFRQRMSQILRRFDAEDDPAQSILEQERQHVLAEQAREVVVKTTTPLQRWQSALDKPVSLAVLPLFAFLNAGVVVTGDAVSLATAPVVIAVALGLALGKVLGIGCFAWLGLKSGLCSLPEGTRLVHIVAMGLLAGIGFTMSLFIAALAFSEQPELLMQAKVGILAGSLCAGIAGVVLFLLNPPGDSRDSRART